MSSMNKRLTSKALDVKISGHQFLPEDVQSSDALWLIL